MAFWNWIRDQEVGSDIASPIIISPSLVSALPTVFRWRVHDSQIIGNYEKEGDKWYDRDRVRKGELEQNHLGKMSWKCLSPSFQLISKIDREKSLLCSVRFSSKIVWRQEKQRKIFTFQDSWERKYIHRYASMLSLIHISEPTRPY